MSLPSGLLLALCFFLPAVRGCSNNDIIPFEELSRLKGSPIMAPAYLLPYLFGLLAALVLGYQLLRPGRTTRKGALGYCILTTLLSLPCVLFFSISFFMEKGTARTMWAVLSLAAIGVFFMLIRGSVTAIEEVSRIGRATWCGSLLCALWFLFWHIYTVPLYGLFLSMGSSLLLALGGLLIDTTVLSKRHSSAPAPTAAQSS